MSAALARRTVTRHRGTYTLLLILEFDDDCKSDGERRLGAMTGGVSALFHHSSSSAHMYVGCDER